MAKDNFSLYSSLSLRHFRHPDAARLLACRDRARRVCVLALARMYGRLVGRVCAHRRIVPFITELNTIGFVEKNYGTAWDSTVLAPLDVLAVGLGQYPDDVVEAPPRWQRIRLGLKEPEDWDPDLLSERRYEPRYWERPMLRAVGLKDDDRIRPLPRRTLHELLGIEIPHDPIPPWIVLDSEPTTTDWLPLSPAQRTQLNLLMGKYQRRRIQHRLGQSHWQAQVSEYLAATENFSQDSDQVIEGLLSHLTARTSCSRQDVINALPHKFFTPVNVDADEKETALEREMCDILYAQGPIYLNIPAPDAEGCEWAFKSVRAFYHRRGLTPPDDL